MAMIMGPSSRASMRPPLKVGKRNPRVSERAYQSCSHCWDGKDREEGSPGAGGPGC